MDFRLERKWSVVGFCTGAIAGLVSHPPLSHHKNGGLTVRLPSHPLLDSVEHPPVPSLVSSHLSFPTCVPDSRLP
jgi:hypothetical protein